MTKTITCSNSFGKDVQKTEEQFVSAWIDTIRQLGNIAENKADFDAIDAMKQKITQMAKKEFERIYAAQERKALNS